MLPGSGELRSHWTRNKLNISKMSDVARVLEKKIWQESKLGSVGEFVVFEFVPRLHR